MYLQATHEDEDEEIEEGAKLVTQILGEGKAHLYPAILQLVMADGVWTEGSAGLKGLGVKKGGVGLFLFCAC